MIRVFISSVQREFAEERQLLCKYIREDALLGKFFLPFIFEELPAINLSAPEAYLTEASTSDIYLGLYGHDYGYEDAEGISPTEREYDAATANNRHRIVFIKRCDERHPKEQNFIHKVEQDVVRKSFADYDELRTAVYAALIRFLEVKEYLRLLPWDATYSQLATIDDIDSKKIASFVSLARQKRGFKMQFTGENTLDILMSLDLASNDGRLTNSALLLFAKKPQRFFPVSRVKCALFYGFDVQKPVPFYQVYEGDFFELVDQAVGFVMNHIDAAVGTRSHGASVDVEYELPVEAVTEAIVNALVHRSYNNNGSVQVMLFRDRLEVWSPGCMPQGITPEKLRIKHKSVPVNPVLATPVYLAGYIEHLGTGTLDIIKKCKEKGLRTPIFEMDEDVVITIWRKNIYQKDYVAQNITVDVAQNVAQNVAQSSTEKRLAEVLTLVSTMKHITQKEIAERLGVTRRTINRDLDLLRASYRIEWIGSPKTGYWEVEKIIS